VPWEFEFSFSGNLLSAILVRKPKTQSKNPKPQNQVDGVPAMKDEMDLLQAKLAKM
jgi:hypothetical protein